MRVIFSTLDAAHEHSSPLLCNPLAIDKLMYMPDLCRAERLLAYAPRSAAGDWPTRLTDNLSHYVTFHLINSGNGAAGHQAVYWRPTLGAGLAGYRSVEI